MSKGNGMRSVKVGNFWLELKETLQDGIKNQWLAFKRNIVINLVAAVMTFTLLFIIESVMGKLIIKDENWLNITLMISVLIAIPWLFVGTIIVKIVYKLEAMLLLIELLMLFIFGVLLNHSIDNSSTFLHFNLWLLLSLSVNWVMSFIKI